MRLTFDDGSSERAWLVRLTHLVVKITNPDDEGDWQDYWVTNGPVVWSDEHGAQLLSVRKWDNDRGVPYGDELAVPISDDTQVHIY